jgi:hypothetical protein
VADGFEVVAATLLHAFMSADGGVTGSSGQIFTVLVGDVFALRVLIALSETEINNVDGVFGLFSSTDEEVIRFDVTVDNSFFVDFLNALEHLDCDEEHGFEVELALAGLEKVFEGGAKEVHDHHVELLVGHRVVRTDVVEAGDACFAAQLVNQLALPEEHHMLLILRRFLLQHKHRLLT